MSETTENSPEPEAEAPVEGAQPVEAAVEETPAPDPEPVVEAAPEPARAARKNSAQQHVATSIEPGTVVLASALVRREFSRRSASVEAVQRRLVELGHAAAGSDPRGRLEAHTEGALEEFRASRGRRLSSATNLELVEALFEGTGVEVLA